MASELELTCYICLDLLSEQPDTTSPVGVAQNAGSSSQTCSTSAETTSELCVTPCGHVFHKECVLPWIRQHKTCPNCRRTRMTMKSLTKIYLPLVPGSCKQCKRRYDSFEIEKILAKREVDLKEKVSQLKTELESKTEAIEERDKKLAELESEIQGKAADEAYFDELWKQNATAMVEQERKAAEEKIEALKRRVESLEYRYKRAKLEVEKLRPAEDSNQIEIISDSELDEAKADGHDKKSNKVSVIVANVKNLTNKTRQPVLEVDLCDSDEDVPCS